MSGARDGAVSGGGAAGWPVLAPSGGSWAAPCIPRAISRRASSIKNLAAELAAIAAAHPDNSPEFNPVERVWLCLRERFLSFRLYEDEQAILDALCAAWTALRPETGRLTSLTSYPWLTHALDQVNG